MPSDIKKSVQIVNAFEGDGNVLLYKRGVDTYYADLGDMSETAALSIQQALSSIKIEIKTIDNMADKQLRVQIKKATASFSSFRGGSTNVILEVKTGSGLVKEYAASAKLGNTWQTTRRFEVAIKRSVIMMLEDPDIIAYLKK